MRALRCLGAFVLFIPGGAVRASGDGGIPEEVAAAAREALPRAMAEEFRPEAGEGEGPGGRWLLRAGEMDGGGVEEVFLVVLPSGKRGEVFFLARREGKKVLRKKVKLKGAPIRHGEVRFEPFTEGRSLAHVDAGEAGEVLLCWDGHKLSTVWEAGRSREGERHWFEIEDLDGDGVAEVISFFQRQLDVFYGDNRDGEGSGGAEDRAFSSERVDALAVYHFVDGRWREDAKLLETLR